MDNWPSSDNGRQRNTYKFEGEKKVGKKVLRPQSSSLNSQAMDLKKTEDMLDKRHQQGGKAARAQIFEKTTTANPPRVQCTSMMLNMNETHSA